MVQGSEQSSRRHERSSIRCRIDALGDGDCVCKILDMHADVDIRRLLSCVVCLVRLDVRAPESRQRSSSASGFGARGDCADLGRDPVVAFAR